MRFLRLVPIWLLLYPIPLMAEVTRVTITSQSPLAGARSFGSTGSYELLMGRIEFALDPADPHNRQITDVAFAPRESDGRVHFSSDLIVLRPTDPGRGNGVLLFELANRGNREMVATLNRGTGNPSTEAGIGDGWLMREGYTIVWVGWEFDLPQTPARDGGPFVRLNAPPATLPASEAIDPVSVDIVTNELVAETMMTDSPSRPPVAYPPADLAAAGDTLAVRDRFWDPGRTIPRESWRFVLGVDGVPKLHLDSRFEPGLWYRVTYRATSPVVAGVGLAAIRDAASAFRYRTDLPVHGRLAYVYGQSQTGRFLREFLYDGFNADETDRRVFDAVWPHIARAALSNANQRFSTVNQGSMFEPTRFPFTDDEERDVDGHRDGLQSRYRPELRPKVFYTNTPVEYWGGGRAAALIHTSVDGTRDLTLPENIRVYFLASTQHLPYPFFPNRNRPSGGGPLINDGQAFEQSGAAD